MRCAVSTTMVALAWLLFLVAAGPSAAAGNPDLLVSSGISDQVLRYDGDSGAFLGVFASGSGLDTPQGLAYGADGNLYVASQGPGEILRFDGVSGAFIDMFASTGGSPRGIVFGPDGHLYVSAFSADVVYRFDGATGALIDTFASGGGLDAP